MSIHRLNKDFDKVVCINLSNRQDKREKMAIRFNNINLEVEWFTAVQYGFIPNIVKPLVDSGKAHFNLNQPYEIGAALSHYAVIKQALDEGCNNLFVFEDDARLHKNFNEKLDRYLDALPNNWDLFLLYSFMYELKPQNIRVNSRWIKSFNSWSLMAYGMNRKFMEEYIQRQNKFFTISDLVTFKMQEEAFNIYSAVPTLCVPDIDLGSNIRGENMNYNSNPTIINFGYSNENYE
jgi:GR25 family glycosyltransferase involved in LPS biosynthesis